MYICIEIDVPEQLCMYSVLLLSVRIGQVQPRFCNEAFVLYFYGQLRNLYVFLCFIFNYFGYFVDVERRPVCCLRCLIIDPRLVRSYAFWSAIF